ncbi:MAG: DUF3307 domain-containing protein [Eubacteriales bacterium]
MVNCYLILLLSHLLTDFVFQSESLARCSRARLTDSQPMALYRLSGVPFVGKATVRFRLR